jgi:PhnB protein
MTSKLVPYIHFKDNAREAMEFYKSVFGGTLNVSTFGDYDPSVNPAEANGVMHAQLEASNGIEFMAADTPSHMEYNPGDTSTMSLFGKSADEGTLRGYFDKLAQGGQVSVPLEKAPWGDTFGMLNDKFGIEWMVNIAGQQS